MVEYDNYSLVKLVLEYDEIEKFLYFINNDYITMHLEILENFNYLTCKLIDKYELDERFHFDLIAEDTSYSRNIHSKIELFILLNQ